MTNIIGTIVIAVVTNWVTVSRTTPVIGEGQRVNAVFIQSRLNQEGHITTNYYVNISWKGMPHQFLLESVQMVNQPLLTRSVGEQSGFSPFVSP